MGFQDSAFSVRARLHLGQVKPAHLIGLLAMAAVVLICAFAGVSGAVGAHELEVVKAASDQGSSSASREGESSEMRDVAPEPVRLCVYVSGEVESPGIYYLDEGQRVADAVALAGGLSERAAPEAVNLARTLVDGEQILIPAKQESSASGVDASAGAYVATAPSANARININTATALQLQELDGIGEATAAKIIADREANGPFRTIEDLTRVSGIGEKKLEALRDRICV